MHLFRCFLLLALLAAVSATGFSIFNHHGPKKCGRRGHPCGGKVFLGSLYALSLGINHKFQIARDIFGSYSRRTAANSLDDGIEIIVNLSRGVAVLLNNFIPGLGGYFQKMIMGSIRYIFCVMDSPWQDGGFIAQWLPGRKRVAAPAICGKDFGRKWGWRKYLRGFGSFDEIDEVYQFRYAHSNVRSLVEDKAGMKISDLKGTKRLVIDIMIKISILLERSPDMWTRSDFQLICRYVITIVAAFGRSYKEGTGILIVEELITYINISLRKANLEEISSEYELQIKEELKMCDRESFNDAIVIYDGNQDIETKNNDESSSDQLETETERKTIVTVEEYDIWYDEDGNVINSTRTDLN